MASASLWQRVVMRVAGFMLLVEAAISILTAIAYGPDTPNEPNLAPLGFGLAAILILGGSGFVFAAARPLGRDWHQILVGTAILAPFAVPVALWLLTSY